MAMPATRRERHKHLLRNHLLDAVIALMASGSADVSHDAIATRTGVARRTVYRYFPNRRALMNAALDRVRSLAGPQVGYPRSACELLATLEPIYTGFDRIAPIATMLRSTPQGRALRMAQNRSRTRSYTRALAPVVRALPRGDRRLAIAMLQVLHTTPWLEMRDHWGLTGLQIARAAGWAVRTLLADLARRGSLPLSEEVSSASDAAAARSRRR